MTLEWQTVVALVIVAATATFFLARLARPKKKKSHGCGTKNCGCDH